MIEFIIGWLIGMIIGIVSGVLMVDYFLRFKGFNIKNIIRPDILEKTDISGKVLNIIYKNEDKE